MFYSVYILTLNVKFKRLDHGTCRTRLPQLCLTSKSSFLLSPIRTHTKCLHPPQNA